MLLDQNCLPLDNIFFLHSGKADRALLRLGLIPHTYILSNSAINAFIGECSIKENWSNLGSVLVLLYQLVDTNV